ncbi:PH domain-containing protein [Tessaracoccus antarcticus]|uniref:PH domain-containing protein n=1 Tax=Tessaracoccus antarcticus TaxID=2479848 RepID=A0A3M0G652_9ACTN|nr:PH domain-containing protein [Tessaracoccus antarcticus]RMB57752.1 PH domain-containing protein [Tessaracoccus antarcticus]
MSAVTPDGPEQATTPERLVFSSVPALLTSLLLSGILLVFALYGWYALGPEIRVQVTWTQAGTLLFFVLVMIGIMLSVGYSRLWADEKGVTVRNGPVLRKFSVDEIAGLRLRSGDAWAYLLIKDGTGVKRRAVLAIQQLEGAQGKKKLRDLREWLKAHGATSKDITLTEE